jgi:hypothetical protein
MYFDQHTHCGFDGKDLKLWQLAQHHDRPLLHELCRPKRYVSVFPVPSLLT